MKNVVWMGVSWELLRQVLYLPAETECISVMVSAYSGDVALVIEFLIKHPDLPNAENNQTIKNCVPTFRAQEPVIFIDWGIQE